MSYILDALKKAAEQRGVATNALLRPSAPLAGGRVRRLPWIAAGSLLLLNVVGLIYLLLPASVSAPPAPPVTTGRQAPARPVTAVREVEPPAPTQVIERESARSAPVKTSAAKPPENATPR